MNLATVSHINNLDPETGDPTMEEPEKHRKALTNHDDPFGDEEVAEIKYRTMSWW